MDGIIEPILQRLKALELHVWGPAADDSGHDQPAQTLHPSRMPLTPGAPIANYDPSVAQDDETDAAVAAETEWKTQPKPAFIPPSDPDPIDAPEFLADGSPNPEYVPPDLDPTLNADGTTKRRRRATVDGDVT